MGQKHNSYSKENFLAFWNNKNKKIPKVWIQIMELIRKTTNGLLNTKRLLMLFIWNLMQLYARITPIVVATGNLLDEDAVLNWMMRQKMDESIEDIDRDTLFEYIETKEFLAVVFCKCILFQNPSFPFPK